MEKGTKEKKIQWHPAFCSAVQPIFQKESASLEYVREHVLNTKPLLIDLLVVKKPPECEIANPLGHIFKGHNIMEYKSPGDAMNIDTYYKTYGYACLYKAAGDTSDAIKADDITISLVRDGKPSELFQFFKRNGYDITNPFPGIYYVKKDGMFDTQVIISSELKDDDQIWLRALAPRLKKTVLSSFLQKTAASFSQGQRDLMDSVLDVVLAANKESVTAMKGEKSK